ncbi:MAG: Rap1a/Tai family immunity protein [Limibacillus sp.]
MPRFLQSALLICALGLAPLALGYPAPTSAYSGGDFLESCKAPAGSEDARHCESYFSALLDAAHTEMLYLRSGCSTSKCRITEEDAGRGFLAGLQWCLSREVTRREALEAASAWLADHPIGRIQPAPEALAEALSQLYPCDG